MDKFTASNGVEVRTNAAWMAVGEFGQRMELAEMQALREFFQANRDEELGRWRWPENPDYVVYARRDDTVLVLFELHGEGGVLYRRGDSVHDFEGEAARAYFAAHPEPKPWHDAQDGEVWLIDCAGTPKGGEPFIVHLGKFKSPTTTSLVAKNDPTITAARRIWPESD